MCHLNTLRLGLGALVAVALCTSTTALAFPTSDHSGYPSYGACSSWLQADAGYDGSNEHLGAYNEDWANCADLVAVQANIMVGGSVTSTTWLLASFHAANGLSNPDYYYGYGAGYIRQSGNNGTTAYTLSVHP